MYSVSSEFAAIIAQKNARLLRRLFIGSSDYSQSVMKYPTLSKQWDDLRAQTATINLSNADQTFNFLVADPTKLRSACAIKFGVTKYTYLVSGYVTDGYVEDTAEELTTMFAGTIDAARFSDSNLDITLIDKFKYLSERKIGDTTSPVNYTSSAYLIHDLAWYVCTSYGGLSAAVTSSNPDIDYASFSSWTSVFSADNVRASAYLTGQQPIEILRKLAKLTQSAIYVENDKIKFQRFSLADVAVNTFTSEDIINANATLDDRKIVNRQFVSADYDVTSKAFGITVLNVNSSSVNNYGLRENLIDDTFVWLTDSVSALNLAQRMITSKSEVYPAYELNVPMQGSLLTVGDTIGFIDPGINVSGNFRIMSERLNLDTGQKTFSIDLSQYGTPFTLDVSALDGTHILI